MAAQVNDEVTTTGRDFERRVADLYRALGATAIHDCLLGGTQVDVFLEESTPSGPVRTAVECKDSGRPVGVDPVRKFAAAARLWRDKNLAEKFVVVAPSGFTRPARAEAETHGIDLVEVADLQAKVNREIAFRDPYVWTADDVECGLASAKQETRGEPIEPGEAVNVALLRNRRLPGLYLEFAALLQAWDRWSASEQRKRGPERLRVFWLTGVDETHRSKALLACMLRAGAEGDQVHDAGRSFAKLAKGLKTHLIANRGEGPLIAIDLDDDLPAAAWKEIKEAIGQASTLPPVAAGSSPRMLIAGTRQQAESAGEVLGASLEITTFNPKGLVEKRVHSHRGTENTPDHIFNRGLPMTTQDLFGREQDLRKLRRAWDSEQTRIFSIEAFGGIGKSALVNTWLAEMEQDGYRGAERVLAWSFYSQGTKENLVSADEFFSEALKRLGIDATRISSPREKGKRLAEAIKSLRTLLILDGMEPLQHPRKDVDVAGSLTDESIRGLLEELTAPDWSGLCVVTTRVPLTDLRRFEGESFEPLELRNLEPPDAARLLEHLIGKPADRRSLLRAVEQVDSHALAVTLMGKYLREAHGGDLAGLADLKELSRDAPEGGHARRVMATHSRWLADSGRLDALGILHLIGLFDRPAQPEAMAALLEHDAVPFSEELEEIGSEAWERCVEGLRGMGLLNEAGPESNGAIDAHPLVREHFQDELRSGYPNAWSRGNRTLYDYYRGKAPPQPASPEQMQPLYAASTHGCAAGLHQEVFAEVLLPRIWRDQYQNFSTRHLGLTGADLVALSNFFRDRQWTELKDVSLSHFAQILVRTNAGLRLRQLGRLQEARRCFGAVLEAIDPGAASDQDLGNASYAAAQHSELLLIEGKLDDTGADGTALESARQAVEYADAGGDPYFRMHARTTLADVHFMRGENPAARELFEEAEKIGRTEEPRAPFLYSQGLYRYGYYLIETGDPLQLLEGERSDPDWGTNQSDSSLLSGAIRLLIGAAARRSLIEETGSDDLSDQAAGLLRRSIDQFQTAGYADYVVRGLIERVQFYRVRRRPKDYRAALVDLGRARFEAGRGQMHLLFADILLQHAACHLAFLPELGERERLQAEREVPELLAEAEELIQDLGYARRAEMLVGLRETAAAFDLEASGR